jgi:hypothetical protein
MADQAESGSLTYDDVLASLRALRGEAVEVRFSLAMERGSLGFFCGIMMGPVEPANPEPEEIAYFSVGRPPAAGEVVEKEALRKGGGLIEVGAVRLDASRFTDAAWLEKGRLGIPQGESVVVVGLLEEMGAPLRDG